MKRPFTVIAWCDDGRAEGAALMGFFDDQRAASLEAKVLFASGIYKEVAVWHGVAGDPQRQIVIRHSLPRSSSSVPPRDSSPTPSPGSG